MIRFHHHGKGFRLQFLEAGVAAILNEELIAAGIANASHRRGRKDNDKGFGNLRANARVHLRQNRRQFLLPRSSLGKFLERQEHGSRVRLIAAKEIEASEFDRVQNARRFASDLRDLVDDRLGAIERRRVGQLCENDGVAAILCWQKTAGHNFEAETS